jgi:hypothetical protein
MKNLTASTILLIAVVSGINACSPVQPIASPRFDGHYIGTRQSSSTEACGIPDQQGKTSAQITNGEITLPLFGPKTLLEGTVGSDGAIRAWGMWQSQETSHFPGMTTFTGKVSNRELEGEASNFKCQTIVRLHKTQNALPLPLPPQPPAKGPAKRKRKTTTH